MKHWSDLIIKDKRNITGRGLVMTVNLKENNLSKTDWVDDVLINKGDTISCTDGLYQVRNVELQANTFDGKKSATIGLVVKKLVKITLCGSAKFKKEYEALNRQLSLEGNIVYSVAFFSPVPLTTEQKILLDQVHKRKIDNSDGIFVLDIDGYIGESTRSEIEYAENNGKFVKYLSDFPDLKMICDATLFNN